MLITSSKDACWQEGAVTEVTSGTADVTVDDGPTAQTWAGFGGTFNEKGWEALSVLSPDDRDNHPWQGGPNQRKAPNDHAYAVESWGLLRDWIKINWK